MKVKKEYLILFILIVAFSVYLLMRQRDSTHYTIPNLPEVSSSKLSRVEITRPEDKILLEKKEEQWALSPEGYPADAGKVKRILETLEGLKLTALVSEAESYERYDLQEGKKITVKAWSGDELKRAFDLGKTAPSFRHTFVKVDGDHRVYHAQENFKSLFDQTNSDLRDKSVLRFKQDEIQSVEIRQGEAILALTRKPVPVEVVANQENQSEKSATEGPDTGEAEGQWQTSDGRDVDESKLQELIKTLSTLNCSDYLEGLKREGLTNPLFQVHLEGLKKYTLSIYGKTKEEDKVYPAVSSENAFPFLLPDTQVKGLISPPEAFLKKQTNLSGVTE